MGTFLVGSPTAPWPRMVAVAYLEHYPEQSGPVERVPLLKFPFTLGRSESNDHPIYSTKVSKTHAVIVRDGDEFLVRDLDSTNGTFVNGARVREQRLSNGDILHVAHVEFCFRQEALEDSARLPTDPAVDQTQAIRMAFPDSVIRNTKLIRELVETEAVATVFQPIVDLETHTIVGYEALGRGTHPELTSSPAPLLKLADQCEMAIELSRLFRRKAAADAHRLPPGRKLFLNVHPREMAAPGLVDSFIALRPMLPPDCTVVIEIAESSVTDVEAMVLYKRAFAERGFECAYDDFGAGQSRIVELTEVPLDYLKLDMGLINGIEAAKSRQDVVRALLQVAGSLGVRVIAEGIETESAAETCRQLGCQMGQGFLFGKAE